MSLARHSEWLDAYGSAWEARDERAFSALFAADAVYRWGPFSDPLRGRCAIEERVRAALAAQAGVRFGHEPLAITCDGRGLSRWWVSYHVPRTGEVEENEGVFLVTLDDSGRCTEFREWWNSRTSPGAT